MAGDFNSEWYYARNGVQTGPFDLATLRGMIAAGQLNGQDLVWNAGMIEWTPIGKVPALSAGGFAAPQYSPPPPAFAPPSGGAPAYPQQQPYAPQRQVFAPHQGYSAQPGYRSAAPQGPSQQGMAIAGFVLSLLVPIVGLILSIVALNGMKTNRNDEGKGFAMAGLIISIAFMVLGCVWIILIFGIMGAAASAAGH